MLQALLTLAPLFALMLCPVPGDAAVTPVCSFGTPADLGMWAVTDGSCELSDQHATEGRMALHITWPSGRGMIVNRGALPSDWSKYEFLKVDVYNPSLLR